MTLPRKRGTAWTKWLVLSFLLPFMRCVSGRDVPVVLDEWLTDMLRVTIELSAESFETVPVVTVEGLSHLLTWTDAANQAVTARYRGRCFIAYRGIVDEEIGDLIQALDIRLRTVCREEILPGSSRRLQDLVDSGERNLQECCEFRAGWVDSIEATYLDDTTAELEECMRDCPHGDDCLVITGASAGAAAASPAATYYARWNPYIFSYGEPPSVVEPCAPVDSSRYYRLVNTMYGETGEIQYDYVAMTPRLRGTTVLGHLLTLSADMQGIAYVGKDIPTLFTPLCVPCHRARSKPDQPDGYRVRINRIFDLNTQSGYTAVRTDGFRDGFPCSTNQFCQSGRCQNGRCLPQLSTCTPCGTNGDCLNGVCRWFVFGCGFFWTWFQSRCE